MPQWCTVCRRRIAERHRRSTTRCSTANCNDVERFFRRLKSFRRIANLYDELDSIFLTFIHLASCTTRSS